MTAKNPGFEVTANYIDETVDLLVEPHNVTEHHVMKSLHVPFGTEKPYVAIAKLEIPRKKNWHELRVQRYGTRTLKVIVLGAAMSREEYYEIPEVVGIGSKAIFSLNNDRVHPTMGEIWYHFNTKGLIDSGATVYREGYHAGIQEDEDMPGFVFDHYGIPQRYRGDNVHRTLANTVHDASLETSNSILRTEGSIDFARIATNIAAHTGVNVPKSLSNTPRVTVDTEQQLTQHPGDPGVGTMLLEMDQRSTDGRMRIITEVEHTTYEGFELDPETTDAHFFFKKYSMPERGDVGIGIDVRQTIYMPDHAGGVESLPNDALEARRMVKPLIQSMTNLRRYANSAYGN